MAAHHITVTLGSGPTAILKPTPGQPSVNCLELQLESETGNTAVQVGGPTVSATDYGRSLAAGPTGQITIRTGGARNINLANTFLLGTAGQKVHALYHT